MATFPFQPARGVGPAADDEPSRGGAAAGVLGGFLDARLADEADVFIAPRIGRRIAALIAAGGRGVERIAEALTLTELQIEQLDGDLHLNGRIG